MSSGTKDDDPFIQTASTIIPQVGSVRLYESTWDKVRNGHPDVAPFGPQAIIDAVTNPTSVHESSTHPHSSYIFVSDATMLGDHPMVVPVRIVEGTSARVTTAYFSRRQGTKPAIWVREGSATETER